MATPELLKDLGNQAFQKKEYRKAIEYFTEAITKAGDDVDGNLHVYYSNRSAAYLHLGMANESLSDAKKCINLKPEWARGYSRKASALFRLKKYRDCIDVFRRGLELDPSNAAMRDGLEDAIRQDRIIRGLDDQHGESRSRPATSAASSSRGAVGLKTLLWSTTSSKVNTVQFGLRAFMLGNFIGYLLMPLMGMQFGEECFSRFMKTALVNYVIHLVWKHGRPQMNQEYGMRLATDPTAHYLFYCVVFLGSQSSLFAFLPILISDGVHFAHFGSQILRVWSPSLASNASRRLDPVMVKATGRTDWPSMDERTRWATLSGRVPQLCATTEVSLGLILLVQLLLPSRNFFVCLLYWQFLRLRYMLSAELKLAFSTINARITALTNHPSCPAIVRTMYGKLQSFLGGMVQMPTANDPQQARPRCTIM